MGNAKRAWGCALLLLGLSASQVFAKDYASTMQFQVFRPCSGNASFCAPMLLAQGEIDEGAPDRLKILLQNLDGAPRIVFDSPGGNLLAGLQLGELIRAWRLDTAVGVQYATDDGESVIASDVVCYSACSYAFMGGVSRLLVEGARLGVHQFDGVADDGLASGQITVAVVSQYMKRMGIDRDVLDAASLTSSGDMTNISRSDAIALNLDNTQPLLAAWELEAMDDGQMAVMARQQHSGRDAFTRLAIAKDPQSNDLIVGVQTDRFFSKRSPEQIPNYLPTTEDGASLCAGDATCAQLHLITPWSYDAQSGQLTAFYHVDPSKLISVVVEGQPISYDADFPSAASDMDPSVELGRQDLDKALLALLKQPFMGDPNEAAPGAITISEATLGSSTDSRLRIAVPKTLFRPDESISLSVLTTSGGSTPVMATLGVSWTYEFRGEMMAVHDESKEILIDGSSRTAFYVTKPDDWPAGTYHAEIFLDGSSQGKLTFQVR